MSSFLAGFRSPCRVSLGLGFQAVLAPLAPDETVQFVLAARHAVPVSVGSPPVPSFLVPPPAPAAFQPPVLLAHIVTSCIPFGLDLPASQYDLDHFVQLDTLPPPHLGLPPFRSRPSQTPPPPPPC